MTHFRLDGLTNKQHYEKTNILTAVMTFTNIGSDGLTNKQHYEKTNILTAVMTFTNIGPLCTCVIFAAKSQYDEKQSRVGYRYLLSGTSGPETS